MMEAKKKYEKPAFRLVTDLGSILECLYEVWNGWNDVDCWEQVIGYGNLSVYPHD